MAMIVATGSALGFAKNDFCKLQIFKLGFYSYDHGASSLQEDWNLAETTRSNGYLHDVKLFLGVRFSKTPDLFY